MAYSHSLYGQVQSMVRGLDGHADLTGVHDMSNVEHKSSLTLARTVPKCNTVRDSLNISLCQR